MDINRSDGAHICVWRIKKIQEEHQGILFIKAPDHDHVRPRDHSGPDALTLTTPP